jgi:hypothetical protein
MPSRNACHLSGLAPGASLRLVDVSGRTLIAERNKPRSGFRFRPGCTLQKCDDTRHALLPKWQQYRDPDTFLIALSSNKFVY